MMHLCLGTVQLGMDYGITRHKRPEVADAIKILDFATQNGIDNIDTASIYGAAEDLVGTFLQQKTIARDKLFIISKFQPNRLDDCDESQYYLIMRDSVENTLSRLRTDYLDCYLLHSSRYIYNDAIVDALNRLKSEGYTRKIGASIYEVDEAKRCMEKEDIDFMQLPYSIFDQRMAHGGVFQMAEKSEIQIHSRSAFIQGLVLMKEEEIPPFLERAKPIIRKIDELCRRYDISRIALAMNYVKCQSAISHLVFGVNNIEQLKEDINLFRHSIARSVVEEISREFVDIETDIVMPSLWKK